MKTKQHKEALHYFNEHADDWKTKAVSGEQVKINVIQQRNQFVMSVIQGRKITKSALDVGCGTGDLVCEIARLKIDSTGVDFASEMVELARKRAKTEELNNAHFFCSSFAEFDLAKKHFDVISANGFIEYISLEELNLFLDLTYSSLNPGGSLILGSRNRLFNIFSANSFTTEEIDSQAAVLLLKESAALASGLSLDKILDLETASLPEANIKHANTGIEVSTRFQFTPIQIGRMLKARGFIIEQFYPIHIHGVPPLFKSKNPEVHTSISKLLQSHADISLLPQASSFMVHAKKAR